MDKILNQILSGNESYLLLWTIVTLLLSDWFLDGGVDNARYAKKLMEMDKSAFRVVLRSVLAVVFLVSSIIVFFYFALFFKALILP